MEFEQKKILWWLRFRWVKFQLSRRFRMYTPAPVRFAIRTALVAFAALFLLPQHPTSMIAAMALGLITALATHEPDLQPLKPRPTNPPVPRRRIRYTVIPQRDGTVELRAAKKYVVRRDGTLERAEPTESS